MGRVFCIEYDPTPSYNLITCSTCGMHILRLPRGVALRYYEGFGAAIFSKQVVNVMTDNSDLFRGPGTRMADLHCVACLTKLGFKMVKVTHPNATINEGTVFLDIQKLKRNGAPIPVPVPPNM